MELTTGPDRTKLGALFKRTNTDDLGEYRFGGLEEGVYVVSARTMQMDISGSFALRQVYYPGVAAVGDAQNIELHPGDEKLGVDFSSIEMQAPQGSALEVRGPIRVVGPNGPISVAPLAGASVIRGRITRGDGLPVANATVSTQVSQATATFSMNLTQSAQTDADGVYEIATLPAGQMR
jgi:hypothetical protein